MLSAPYRFRNRQRFKRALALPRVAGNAFFSLCGQAQPPLENTQPAPRWGVSAPTQWAVVVRKKVCRKAVDRNRLRRRLQALLRQHMVAAKTCKSSPLWQQYGGLVLITRPPSAMATFTELSQSLAELLQRIRPLAPLVPSEVTP